MGAARRPGDRFVLHYGLENNTCGSHVLMSGLLEGQQIAGNRPFARGIRRPVAVIGEQAHRGVNVPVGGAMSHRLPGDVVGASVGEIVVPDGLALACAGRQSRQNDLHDWNGGAPAPAEPLPIEVHPGVAWRGVRLRRGIGGARTERDPSQQNE